MRPDPRTIGGEIEGILQRARQRSTTVVGLGPLVLFSTDGQDAWLLDWEDCQALCLMRGGERQPARVLETPGSYAIGWSHAYEIDGDVMLVHMLFHARGDSPAPAVHAVRGYPTAAIRDVVDRLRRARG